MKIKVRNGVFETNSSSTHSFTIVTEKEKIERKQKLEKQLKDFRKIVQEHEKNGTVEYYMYIKLQRLENEFIGCNPSCETNSLKGKLFWFKNLKEYVEEKESIIDGEPIPNNEMQEILIERLKNINPGTLDIDLKKELETEISCLNGYDIEMLLWKLFMFDCKYNEIINQYPILKDISHYYVVLKLEAECMYNAIIEEYCTLCNIKREKANKEFLYDNNKKLTYEKQVAKFANDLYKNEGKFKHFVASQNFADIVQAFKKYVNFVMEKRCNNFKNTECDNYFGNGTIDDCNHDFINLVSIYLMIKGIKNKLSKDANKNLSYEEFAKQFLSDKYKIYSFEYYNP